MTITPRSRPPLLDQRLPSSRRPLQPSGQGFLISGPDGGAAKIPPPFPLWLVPVFLGLATAVFLTVHFTTQNLSSPNYNRNHLSPNTPGSSYLTNPKGGSPEKNFDVTGRAFDTSSGPTPFLKAHKMDKLPDDNAGIMTVEMKALYGIYNGEAGSPAGDPDSLLVSDNAWLQDQCLLVGSKPAGNCTPQVKRENNLKLPKTYVDFLTAKYNKTADTTRFSYNLCSQDASLVAAVSFSFQGTCCVKSYKYFGSTTMGGLDTRTCNYGFTLDTAFTTKKCATYTIDYLGEVPTVTKKNGGVPVTIVFGPSGSTPQVYLLQTVDGPDCRKPFVLPTADITKEVGMGDDSVYKSTQSPSKNGVTAPSPTAFALITEGIAGIIDDGGNTTTSTTDPLRTESPGVSPDGNIPGDEQEATDSQAPLPVQQILQRPNSSALNPQKPKQQQTTPPLAVVPPQQQTTPVAEIPEQQITPPPPDIAVLPPEQPKAPTEVKPPQIYDPAPQFPDVVIPPPGTTETTVPGPPGAAGEGGAGGAAGEGGAGGAAGESGNGGAAGESGNGGDGVGGNGGGGDGGDGGGGNGSNGGGGSTGGNIPGTIVGGGTGYTDAVSVQKVPKTNTSLYSTAIEDCTPTGDIGYKSKSGQDEAIFEIYYTNPYKCGGVVVEIDAGDGITSSASFFFEYAMKWKAVLFEANPDTYADLKSSRPQASTYNGAFCSNKEKQLTYSQGNFFTSNSKDISSVNTTSSASQMKGVEVPCLSMSTELSQLKLRHVDVMYISVSGNAFAVLESFDFTMISVSIWVLNLDPLGVGYGPISATLKKYGYVKAEWDIKRWCSPVFGSCMNNEVWLEAGFNPLPDNPVVSNSRRRLMEFGTPRLYDLVLERRNSLRHRQESFESQGDYSLQ